MSNATHTFKTTLRQLTWFMNAPSGVETYHGQFLKEASGRWVAEHAAGRENDIHGIYLNRWDDYQSFRLLMEQMRQASGLQFKVIPANPSPHQAGDNLVANAEILIDCGQPDLEAKLTKATQTLLAPFKHQAQILAQQTIDRLQQKEHSVKSSDAARFAAGVDALQKNFQALIDSSFASPEQRDDTSFLAAKVTRALDHLAHIDIQNDAIVAQCYRAKLYLDPLFTVLGASQHPILQTQLRSAMDALGFPDPLKDLNAAAAKQAKQR